MATQFISVIQREFNVGEDKGNAVAYKHAKVGATRCHLPCGRKPAMCTYIEVGLSKVT